MSAPVVLSLQPTAHAPCAARRDLRRRCAMLPTDMSDDTLLLTTELVTNAVRYGAGEITVRVWPESQRVRVEVSDATPRRPKASHAGPDDESGRGLDIVASLASRWGTFQGPATRGKTVWFELEVG
jgi:anti-sigma regulatory factor (Ser/Thr protein kinase)